MSVYTTIVFVFWTEKKNVQPILFHGLYKKQRLHLTRRPLLSHDLYTGPELGWALKEQRAQNFRKYSLLVFLLASHRNKDWYLKFVVQFSVAKFAFAYPGSPRIRFVSLIAQKTSPTVSYNLKTWVNILCLPHLPKPEQINDWKHQIVTEYHRQYLVTSN